MLACACSVLYFVFRVYACVCVYTCCVKNVVLCMNVRVCACVVCMCVYVRFVPYV